MENTNPLQYNLYSGEDLLTDPAIYSREPDKEPLY